MPGVKLSSAKYERLYRVIEMPDVPRLTILDSCRDRHTSNYSEPDYLR